MAEAVLRTDVASSLGGLLPKVAEHVLAALVEEVPEYAGALDSRMSATIDGAVQMALGGFLRIAGQADGPDPGRHLRAALEGAYALGRGEARSGRTMDALLAAYRVGARVSWRDLSDAAVAAGLAAGEVSRFAELVFAYIDELSAASVAGHADELATSGRVREQYRERLARALLAGAPAEELAGRAERADWTPPAVLAVVLLPAARGRDTLPVLDPRVLAVPGDLADPPAPDDTLVLLVPGGARAALLHALAGRPAVVGPDRPWTSASISYRRALRVPFPASSEPVDADLQLASLVLTADPEALADLRTVALAPLAGLPPATAARLAETLRSWLLHHGRREEVAADLHVHPQTVRYRMSQLREAYGDDLTDPDAVLRLTIALAAP